MGKKGSKDPRKPSKGFLEATGSSKAAGQKTISSSTGDSSKDVNGRLTEKDLLRQAIRDLGGDEEDFELLKDLSDDEEEIQGGEKAAKSNNKSKKDGDASVEKKLKSDLASFMKSLDFAAATPLQDDVESEDDEEADESVDEEDDSDDVSDDDNEEDVEDDDEEEEEEEDEEEDEEESRSVEGTSVAQAETSKEQDFEPEFVIKSGMRNTNEARVDNVPQEPLWYNTLLVPLGDLGKPLEPLPPFKFAAIQSRANGILSQFREAQAKAITAGKSSTDAAFISQVLKDGTHQDKLSALVLLVRESPLHRMNELERLKSMAGGSTGGGLGGREEKVATIRAIADWWTTGGGKEVGKLRYLPDQPLLAHPHLTDRHLLMYAFEDWLKKWFFSLLATLEVHLHDTLPYVRTQALSVTFRLLSGNAEQEQNLLRLGVNKLGDPDKTVASKASHHLLVLLQSHPAMKAVVVREVASLVLKPIASAAVHTSAEKKGKSTQQSGMEHARYYGLITLNQIMLTVEDRDVAARLIDVYFEVFRELLGNKEEDQVEKQEQAVGKVNKWQGRRKGTRISKRKEEPEEEQGESKLVSAVLTGMNRALPFARLEEKVFTAHAETLFRVTHTGTFNISVRALMLIYQIAAAKESIMDRFYRTLYESLLDPRLTTSSKQAFYLNLLFKAIRSDSNLGRVMAFVKRLLQVMMGHQPPFICGSLFLLGELFSTNTGLRALLKEPEEIIDAESSYDGRKRDPAYANAQASCLWELLPFLNHFHPSVSLQAGQLLDLSLPLTGSADITQNTLIAFLDRFVYRNPKKNISAKGASIMQPAAARSTGSSTIIRSRAPAGATEDGYVNSESFWRKKVEEVPADQLFFHKYFATKLEREEAIRKAKKKRSKGDDEDDLDEEADDDEVPEDDGEDEAAPEEEEESDPEEAEIWRVMQATMPGAGEDEDLLDDEGDETEMSSDEEDEAESSTQRPTTAADSDEESQDLVAEFGEDDDEDVELPLDEDSDDLLDLDDMSDIPLDVNDSEDEAPAGPGDKRKRGKDDEGKKKKRRALPLLASAEDYAAMIDAAEEENL